MKEASRNRPTGFKINTDFGKQHKAKNQPLNQYGLARPLIKPEVVYRNWADFNLMPPWFHYRPTGLMPKSSDGP